MLKVLLVDDEISILNGLCKLIDWEQYGFTVIEKVRNGFDALEYIKKADVDVVLTDVKMPIIDGISLIEQVTRMYKDIQFIILSGYDDFQYAKKAIHLNVCSYLLKPIDKEELILALYSIKRHHEERMMYLKQMLCQLLDRNFSRLDYDEERDHFSSFYTENETCKFTYAIIEVVSNSDFLNSKQSNAKEDIGKVYDRLKSFVSEKYYFCIINESTNRFGIVVSTKMIQQKNISITDYFFELKKYIEEAECAISVLVAETVGNIMRLSESKVDIAFLEDVRFYMGYDSVLLFQDYADMVFTNTSTSSDLTDEFIKEIMVKDKQEIDFSVESFIKIIKAEKILPRVVLTYIDNVIVQILKDLENAGGEALRLGSKYSVFHKMASINIKTVEIFLKDICAEYKNSMETICKRNCFGFVGEIIKYIDEYFYEDLSVGFFAKKYYVNSSYLGYVFKQKYGVNINKYLNNVRIEHAKKLIRSGQLKNYEIAERVGFSDAGYFTKKFEEVANISPNEYRKNLLEQ